MPDRIRSYYDLQVVGVEMTRLFICEEHEKARVEWRKILDFDPSTISETTEARLRRDYYLAQLPGSGSDSQ